MNLWHNYIKPFVDLWSGHIRNVCYNLSTGYVCMHAVKIPNVNHESRIDFGKQQSAEFVAIIWEWRRRAYE